LILLLLIALAWTPSSLWAQALDPNSGSQSVLKTSKESPLKEVSKKTLSPSNADSQKKSLKENKTKASSKKESEQARSQKSGHANGHANKNTDKRTNKNTDNNTDKNTNNNTEEPPLWNCRVDSTPADKKGFTVGERLSLVCEGERVSFGQGDMYFQLPENLLFAIRILDIDEVTSNRMSLTVTTYIAGKIELKDVYFAEDGVERFKVKPFIIASQSVIKNPEQKPFPPRTGVRLAYPAAIKMSLGALGFLILLYLFYRWYRRDQKQRVLYSLKKHSSALGAYNQFNKDLRGLGRNYVFSSHSPWSQDQVKKYLESLDALFRMFLLREFLVPANEWKSNPVVKEIQKFDKIRFKSYGSSLSKYLKELDRARKVEDQVSMEDCQQLTILARKVSQKIWRQRKGAS